jgi:hypothetical protein
VKAKLACALGALLAGCGSGRLNCEGGVAPAGGMAFGAGNAVEQSAVRAPFPCSAEPDGAGVRYACARPVTGDERFSVTFSFRVAAPLPTSGEAVVEGEPSVVGEVAVVQCTAAAGCGVPVRIDTTDRAGSRLRLAVSHAGGARSVTLSGLICEQAEPGADTFGVDFGGVPLALP